MSRSNSNLYFSSEAFVFDWSKFAPRRSLICLPAVAVAIFGSLAAHHAGAGLIAGGGAVSVGFGSFHRIQNSRVAPMLLASIGMFASTFVGTIAGHRLTILVSVAALWGFSYGLLAAVGADARCVGLQCVIVMLVSSGYPQPLGHAAIRAFLILGGGLLQTLFITLLRFAGPVKLHELALPKELGSRVFLPVAHIIEQNLTISSEVFQYGLRLAVTLAITAGAARYLSLMDGYWAPMTALLVLKPDVPQTLVRGTARIVGTLAGAALATVIAVAVRPAIVTVALLVIFFAWLGYSVLNVNYATYVLTVTAYVVFLLALGGLSEINVVKFRAIHTVFGGAIALFAYALWPVKSRNVS